MARGASGIGKGLKARRQPSKILVVEDEPELLAFVLRYLQDLGYEVISAMDGIEGLNLARQADPALILLDVMLPKLNGFTISRLLKFDDQYRHIPIIMWTWREADQDREMGIYAGADVYLPKPFSIGKLQESIVALIGVPPSPNADVSSVPAPPLGVEE